MSESHDRLTNWIQALKQLILWQCAVCTAVVMWHFSLFCRFSVLCYLWWERFTRTVYRGKCDNVPFVIQLVRVKWISLVPRLSLAQVVRKLEPGEGLGMRLKWITWQQWNSCDILCSNIGNANLIILTLRFIVLCSIHHCPVLDHLENVKWRVTIKKQQQKSNNNNNKKKQTGHSKGEGWPLCL